MYNNKNMDIKKQNKIIRKAINFLLLNINYKNIEQSSKIIKQLKKIIEPSHFKFKNDKQSCPKCNSENVVYLNELNNECRDCKCIYRILN